ncbi:DNA ligase IV [Mycena amicta]|nr:DNA ligase IV [Mycena amicta]
MQQGDDYPTPPENAGSAPFAILAALFERLSNERKLDRRKKLIGTWFNHWRDEKGHDLYPVLRLILPQKDRERAVYGLKEKTLAKAYIKLIPLQTRDPDAIRLQNWKKPTEQNKASGDFPTVLFDVVSKRSSVIEGSLSVDDLNDILDDLSKNIGKQDYQAKILQRIYNRCTPEEQRWIIRIILKDMVISVKETTVFSVFHPDAQDLYNTCSDLKKVAWQLWDPSNRLKAEDKAVKLCAAFAPMLCKRPTRSIDATVQAMGGTEFYIEEKLDGERMQLHKRGNEYFYCSRKGKDYTYLYGKHVGTGSLTPYIAKAFDPRVEDIVLDGEMLVWDPVSQRNLPFGTLKTAALDKSKKEHNPRPCFKVFDLLYLNGQSLIDKSVTFRKKNMRGCLKEVKGRIEYATEYRGKTAKDVRQRMDEVMEARGEGLVIKHPASKYLLNGRNMDWIKVKPEYMDNMGETVDVLVVAGNYGSGQRGGGVSTLICAVVDDRRPSTDPDEEPKYSSFVRIGSGLSFADYVWVRSLPWKIWDPKNPPAFLQTAKKSHEDKGDMYLLPEDSFILKIKAAEIVPSEQYDMGYTMRFPRALTIRDDLTIADCMPASAVLESLRTVKKRRLESDTGSKKKRKITVTKKVEVLSVFKGEKLSGVKVESDLFAGTTFVVIPDGSTSQDENKTELSKLIKAHGGTLATVAKPQSSIFLVYGGTRRPLTLQSLINKGIYDVITPKWIKDSIALGQLAPLRKKYFFHATESRMADDEYDEEGDDDEPDAGPSTLKSEEDADDFKPKVEEELDPALKDWFKVEEEDKMIAPESDTQTENDSDNDDVNEAEVNSDLDDWLDVKPPPTDAKLDGAEDVRMGESETAMEYDQELIFKHLCFYLDSPENARKNGMNVKTKQEEAIEKSFAELASTIEKNGGKVVDLDEGKLTHVVVDKRDASRRVELMKRTSQPKRRHLVISEFIEACLEDGTPVDEDEFNP